MDINKFIKQYDNLAKKKAKELSQQYKSKLEPQDLYQEIILILCQLYNDIDISDKPTSYIIKCIDNRIYNYINRIWLKNPLSNADSLDYIMSHGYNK